MSFFIVAIILFAAGAGVLFLSAVYRVQITPERRTLFSVMLLDIGRSIGALLCGLAILTIFVYSPLINNFFAEIGGKVGQATLQSIMPIEVAEQIDKYIVRAPFYYGDIQVEYNLWPDPKNPTCLIGTQLVKKPVYNRNPQSEAYPVKIYITDLSQKCSGTSTKSMKVFDREGGRLLVDLSESALNQATSSGDELSWDTIYTIPANGSIFLLSEYDLRVEAPPARDRLAVRVVYPTKSISLTASFKGNFRASGRFSHAAKGDPEICAADEIGSNPYHLKVNCALLPFQAVEIYWPPE